MTQYACQSIPAIAILFTLTGCLPPPCSEANLKDVYHLYSIDGASADRIILDRGAYPHSPCIPRNTMLIPQPVVSRTLVSVNPYDLTINTVLPAYSGDTQIVTDTRWAVITDRTRNQIILRNLDSGDQNVLVDGIEQSSQWATTVHWPYVFIQSVTGPAALLNVATNESWDIQSDISEIPAFADSAMVYHAVVDDPMTDSFNERLVLRDLVTGNETTIKDTEHWIEYLRVFDRRVVWVEQGKTVFVYDRNSQTISSLIKINGDDVNYPNQARVEDIGEPGVLVHRIRTDYSRPEQDSDTIELVDFNGGSRILIANSSGIGQIAFVGPFVVYNHYDSEDRWVSYNTPDGTTRTIDPFGNLATSQPAS